MASLGNYDKLWLTDQVTTSGCVYGRGSLSANHLTSL
jgi:hypothetical protein